MRLGLGTVQFGLDYGISNPAGRTPEEEVRKILDAAAGWGISLLDTAASYGDSEEVLGRCLPPAGAFRIVTKTPLSVKRTFTQEDADRLKEACRASLERLGGRPLHGLLIHNADDLIAPQGEILWRAMEELKAEGAVEKIGVSVYCPRQLEDALRNYPLEIVQAPVNVLDRRFPKSGLLGILRERGVEIHVRSVFLQGLLLMDPEELPGPLSFFKGELGRYRRFLRERGLSPLEAALKYVKSLGEIDAVIVGVNNLGQLEGIWQAWSSPKGEDCDLSAFSVDDPKIVDPRNWTGQASGKGEQAR